MMKQNDPKIIFKQEKLGNMSLYFKDITLKESLGKRNMTIACQNVFQYWPQSPSVPLLKIHWSITP